MPARNHRRARFVDPVTTAPRLEQAELWEPIVVTREELEREVQRLETAEGSRNGRRATSIVHPDAFGPGLGLAPGISVDLEVLLPGESTSTRRHNSSLVNFCISGRCTAIVDGERLDVATHDVWTVPSLAVYRHQNDTDETSVRLVYSNAPVLEKLRVHWVDDEPPERPAVRPSASVSADELFGDFPFDHVRPVGTNGAMLMSYEKLINPDIVLQRPLHWRWDDVRSELDRLASFGSEYRGRRLYLLYNEATGRTNGTTNSFFATMTVRPPGVVDRPHRHVSAAINYYFAGSGYSRVGGQRYDWKAGDLMLSAPGWAIHHHAAEEGQGVYELTVQDSPFHLATDSLLWQENLSVAPRLLGSHDGFVTNRAALGTSGRREGS